MTLPETLRVRVLDIQRRPVGGAKVRLTGGGLRKAVELKFNDVAGIFSFDGELQGEFTLEASAKGLETQERAIKLPHPPTPEEFILGKKGLPFYFRGTVRTPFESKPQLIGITLRDQEAAGEVQRIAQQLGLSEVETHEQVRSNNVRVYRYPARISAEEKRKAFDRLLQSRAVRVAGPVVEMFEQRLVFLTNQFIVRFTSEVNDERVRRIADEFNFKVVRPIAVAGNGFLFEGEATPDYTLLDAANLLAAMKEVVYSEPNSVTTSMMFAVNPTDFLVAQQWHIPLIHLPDAWQALRDGNAAGVVLGGPGDRTFGGEDLQIVVFDTGVQTTTPGGVATPTHPEFQGNVSSGAQKMSAFYDFANMVANNNALVFGSNHGMGCAGVTTARANNPSTVAGQNEGVAGAAGNCRAIGICAPFGQPNLRWADAFAWMAGIPPAWVADGVTYPVGTVFPLPLARGVDIHTNSVRIPDVGLMDDALDFLATYGRGGRGVVSFLAAGNTAAPISNPSNNTIADHDKVITVAASINTDVRASYSCFDPAIDICAPSSGGPGQPLAPGKVTTATVGGGNLAGHTGGGMDYRNDFGGTSSATPLAAGVGALMLTISPNLNWVQVRELLRNTAIKIDAANTDPVGQWTMDGMGNPVFSQWYGFGRVDAAAAVIGARDFGFTTDVVIRDNLGDTGAVPSTGWHADSPDIWTRKTNDPIPVLAYTAAPPHENPRRGQPNWVYLRVKNIGTGTTNEVYLRALICHFPGFEFRYPTEWQPSTPPSSPAPSPLVPGSYLIGVQMIDNLGPSASTIVKMQWAQNLVPPETVLVGGMTVTWHPCLLAEVSPHDGPGPSPGTHDVKRYNDLAHKNIAIDPALFSDGFAAFGVVAGSAGREGVKSVVIDRSMVASDARVFVRIDDREIMERWVQLAKDGLLGAAANLPWRTQSRMPSKAKVFADECKFTLLEDTKVLIGCCDTKQMMIEAKAGTRLYGQSACDSDRRVNVEVARQAGHEVIFLDAGGDDSMELPTPLRGNEYVPIAIGIVYRGRREFGSIKATQRLADGELSPGYEIRS